MPRGRKPSIEPGRKCSLCGSTSTRINKRSSHSQWYRRDKGYLCHRCFSEEYRKANREYLTAVQLTRYYKKKLALLEKKDKRLVRSIERKLARRNKLKKVIAS